MHVVFHPHRDSILRNKRTEAEKAGEKVTFLSFLFYLKPETKTKTQKKNIIFSISVSSFFSVVVVVCGLEVTEVLDQKERVSMFLFMETCLENGGFDCSFSFFF